MKKKLLSLALCVCMSATLATGCSKDKESEDTETGSKTEDLISVDDDNAEALHKILMKQTGDAALANATIADYAFLELEVEDKIEITDEVFQEELDYLLESYAYVFSGQAVSGDTVNIDYEGSMNGELFEGGSDTGFDLELGSGVFIPGFEEQLVGMNVGETKTIDVTFPAEYQNTDYAGKPAQFKVTANYIMKNDGTKAELTEQWIAAYLNAVGGTVTDASVDGFKDYLRTDLEAQAEEIRTSNVSTALEAKLIEILELKDIPEEQTSYYYDMVKTNIEANITSSYSMTIDEYLTELGMTEEEYKEEINTIATDMMKGRYAVILIAEQENLAPTEEEYTALLQEYADMNSMTLDEFRSGYQEQYQLDIYFEAYADKVMDRLLESAVISAPTEETTEDTETAE